MKRTVLEMLRQSAAKYPNTFYTCQKGDNGWVGMTYPDILQESLYLASGLIELGYKKGDNMSILAEGRNRWISSEYSFLFIGATSVPLSIKLLPEEALFRLNHSESKAIVVSKNTFEKVASVWNKMSSTKFIIYLDDDLDSIRKHCEEFSIDSEKDIIAYGNLLELGMKNWEKNKDILIHIEDQIQEDDVVTISYTSGTTGDPKGIMLTHLNYYSNSTDSMDYFNVAEGDRLYIILPLDHSFAHTVGIYAGLTRGLSLYFVDARGGGLQTLKNIPINLVEANPHFMLTVPAISGSFMQKIKDGVKSKGKFIYGLFLWGLNAGIKTSKDGYHKAGILIRMWNWFPHKIADMLVFSKVRKIFGNSIKFCVGGGALLDIRQQVFFNSIGVPIYQGYGLTEAAPIISANTTEVHKFGTSGMVIPNLECKIIKSDGSEARPGEKGEIVIFGKNVMKGYFKNPEATSKTIKDGWLYTGDLGYYDEDGFLIVIGREKALLISADGEKYSPEGIEEAIQNCAELINQVMIHNDMGKYTVSIVTLHDHKVKQYVESHKISDPEILLKAIKQDLNAFAQTSEYKGQFPEKWIPGTFQVAPEPFSEANFQLNSQIKMVRQKIKEVYKERIDFMYTPGGSNINNEYNRDTVKKYLPF